MAGEKETDAKANLPKDETLDTRLRFAQVSLLSLPVDATDLPNPGETSLLLVELIAMIRSALLADSSQLEPIRAHRSSSMDRPNPVNGYRVRRQCLLTQSSLSHDRLEDISYFLMPS